VHARVYKLLLYVTMYPFCVIVGAMAWFVEGVLSAHKRSVIHYHYWIHDHKLQGNINDVLTFHLDPVNSTGFGTSPSKVRPAVNSKLSPPTTVVLKLPYRHVWLEISWPTAPSSLRQKVSLLSQSLLQPTQIHVHSGKMSSWRCCWPSLAGARMQGVMKTSP